MSNKVERLKVLFPEDKYLFSTKLSESEIEVLEELDKALEKHLTPVLTQHTENATFPFDEFYKVVEEVKFLSDPRLYSENDSLRYVPSQYYFTYLFHLLSRFDTSIATFAGVHAGLGYYSILIGGSEEQKSDWLPKLQSFELQTCFALTEPEHGSDVAGGLATTVRKEGNQWIINGEKRWIGGAGTADIIPVYARDEADGKIKCFIVKKNQKGLKVDKIENKNALRMVQNGHIYLTNVVVDDDNRLPNINGFKDVAKILYATRSMVAVIATGLTVGAYRSALDYTSSRYQFGKKLTQFQLIQEKLSRMLGNITSQMAVNAQIAELQTAGEYDEVRSSIAKMQNSLLMRNSVALAREMCGGNGIIYENNVARFFQDAEAIYTYEGTHEINALVIGRSITGDTAFI